MLLADGEDSKKFPEFQNVAGWERAVTHLTNSKELHLIGLHPNQLHPDDLHSDKLSPDELHPN